MKFLSRQEEFAIIAILKLDHQAYGITILEMLTNTTGKKWTIGALYDILDRLERKDLITSFMGESSPVRGGKRKKYYKITKDGLAALEESMSIQKKIWGFLPQELKKKV